MKSNRWIVLSLLLSITPLGANAGEKTYVTGTLINIESSHDSTTYKGTSVGSYYEDYTVQVGNMIYTAWCEEKLFHGCDINFVLGAPVQVRFNKSSMFLLRANGKEQKANIEKQRIVH